MKAAPIVRLQAERAKEACSARRAHSGESTRRLDPLAWIAVCVIVLALLVLLSEVV